MAAAAILGAVASLVGPAIEIGKCFQKQLNYLCCFQTNVKALDDAAKNLADAEADLQVRVDGAKRNGEQILNQVETWLAKAEETRLNNTLGIGTQKPRILNLKSRYSLSRKAIKTAQSMNLLRDTCNFNLVSNPALPASMHHEGRPLTPPAPSGWIESRKKIEDDIIIAMRERNAYVIGVCGMGGVGKTTMANQIMNRAKGDEGIFDEVLLVAVGERADMLQIQHDILDWLGLKLNEETLAPRAFRLRDRLIGGNKKLIVIDDVWERINLEEIGIPCQSDSCTILLTSRDNRVLRQMNAQRVFTVQNLSEEEAWSMFQENVGACLDDDPNLLPTAMDVAKECKGLPLALVAVSRALKDQASKGIWSDALKQLQSSNPVDIPGFIEDVYNPIRLSFDFLKSPHAKSLLFLCSSFPDDHEISLEDLALYGFGLCILGDDINNLEEARNRITWLVDLLKSRFLILDGEDKYHVKLHDVVRDVAIFIAKQENHAILDSTTLDRSKQNPHINDCSMLSVFQNQRRFDFPTGLIFPNLSFLWMYNPDYKRCAVSDNFFKGMQQLKVLSITYFSLGLTPQNMRLLENLRTLHLYECHLETISAVGELSSLEILCCILCSIKELSMEIGKLQRLRFLEVRDCSSLKTIVPGVISRLGQLEELTMVDSFKGWESKEIENERRNASLAELQSLSKLTCLEIEIEDWSLDAQVLQLSSKIVKYNILVGKRSLWEPTSLQMSTSLRNWIDVFARTAQYLCLQGFDSNGFDPLGHQTMRCLKFINCQTVVKLSTFRSWHPFFSNLKVLEIKKCFNMNNLFSYSVALSLVNLEKLIIKSCDEMAYVVTEDDAAEISQTKPQKIIFHKLEELRLYHLPKLQNFCEGRWDIQLPLLKKLNIVNVGFYSARECVHLFCNTQSTFGSLHPFFSNLEELTIQNCVNMNNLFSYSVAAHLVNLITLDIRCCDEMAYVVTEDDAAETSETKLEQIILHKLEYLKLNDLPKLQNFCEGRWDLQFPSLKTLDIKNMGIYSARECVHLFFNAQITFDKLEYLSIHGYLGEHDHIKHLFSYSVAGNLVNLKSLYISNFSEMIYVIVNDDDDVAKTSHEKKSQTIFHKLKLMELKRLPKLQSLCDWGWDVQFPSLETVDIIDCPGMEGVSYYWRIYSTN